MPKKVVVITGASSGIGAALAELLAGRGDAVVIVARRRDALDAVARRSGGETFPIVADCTVRDEVCRIVREAIARYGHVDVWVNNVGRGITRPPSQLSDEDVDEMIQVNVKSALYGTQAILPHFKERGNGHVVTISSMLGRIPYAINRSAYNGSKHFLSALTANFRAEIQPAYPGIHFSLVSPGAVRTEFGRNSLHGGPDSWQLPDTQSAEEVAAIIAAVLDSRKPDVYTRPGSRNRVVRYFEEFGSDP